MQIVNRKREVTNIPQAFGRHASKATIIKILSHNSLEIYECSISKEYTDEILTLQWKMEGVGVKGSWTSNNILDKRFRTDWEDASLKSSISVDAPVINLFGFHDENVVTVGCSDLINLINIEASYREEDNHFYFKFHFFIEKGYHTDYKAKLYINKGTGNFSHVIQEYSDWVIDENKTQVRNTPELAKVPLYSTWYSFHQALDTEKVIQECIISKEMGYDLVVIDDGWQTLDDRRGYDYTGDWHPERIPNMKEFVQEIHNMGMGMMLWYSVPFCGRKSKAYNRFKGKFLTEKHDWAPVFDPRFPEVRNYLTELYSKALLEWNLDGFKLDFIDDFKVYHETELKELNGRDTLSVAQGCKKLISEITAALTSIKPDVLIEFRQQYINPALRELGNMFRAFDCPNDALMNRVRTTDVKLLCGNNAVHSDMLTWHKNEPIEVAALQFSNIIFSVPQLSVLVSERSADELAMIKFYTSYWIKNRDTLLGGKFTAFKPLSNYPFLSVTKNEKEIHGIYEDVVLPISLDKDLVHIINGKLSDSIAIQPIGNQSEWKVKVVDCKGDIYSEKTQFIESNLQSIQCPPNGIIFLTKIA